MSVFDLDKSVQRALARDSVEDGRQRRPRADRGEPRIAEPILAILRELLTGRDRPPVEWLLAELGRRSQEVGLAAPSRATVYHWMERLDVHRYRALDLPEHVRRLLYNLAEDAEVPGRQLALYCFNYGGLAELSYGAGLPWIDLYQAARLRGFRPRSRGLLEAVLKARGI